MSRWITLKKPIIALLLLLGVAVLLLGALWAGNLFGWRAWRIQEVQAFLGAPLPAHASEVSFATQSSATRVVWLRFSLPSGDELAPFLSVLGIEVPLQPGFTPFPVPNPQEAALAWWTPPSAPAYAGRYTNTGQKVIEVLAVESPQPVVYLRAYRLTQGG